MLTPTAPPMTLMTPAASPSVSGPPGAWVWQGSADAATAASAAAAAVAVEIYRTLSPLGAGVADFPRPAGAGDCPGRGRGLYPPPRHAPSHSITGQPPAQEPQEPLSATFESLGSSGGLVSSQKNEGDSESKQTALDDGMELE